MKDYKYAIVIDGVPYLLTDNPTVTRQDNGRTWVDGGAELMAELSPTSSYILVPFEDWLSAQCPKRGR